MNRPWRNTLTGGPPFSVSASPHTSLTSPSTSPTSTSSTSTTRPTTSRAGTSLLAVVFIATVVLGAVVAVTVLGATGLASASPQPYPLCGPCYGPGGAVGENVTVVESTVDVELHANGSATWVVENRLEGDGVETLRDDDTDLQRVAAASAQRRDVRGVGYGGEPPEDVHATLHATDDDDHVMTVEYRDPGAATPAYGDSLVVSYFRFAAGNPGIVVNADRFTMTGPAGYTLQSGGPDVAADERGSVSTGTGSGDAVTLHGEPMVEGGTTFGADADLVYAPADAHAGTATVALLWVDRDAIVGNLFVVFGPGILLAGLLTVLTIRLAVPAARTGTLVTAGAVGGLTQLAVVIRIGDLTGFHQIWPAFTLYYAAIGLAVGVIAGGVGAAVVRFGPALVARAWPATLRND